MIPIDFQVKGQGHQEGFSKIDFVHTASTCKHFQPCLILLNTYNMCGPAVIPIDFPISWSKVKVTRGYFSS